MAADRSNQAARRAASRTGGWIGAMLLSAALLALPGRPAMAEPAAPVACRPDFAPPAELKARLIALCGIHAPEDIEILADHRHLIVSETRGLDNLAGQLGILDLGTRRADELPRLRDGKPLWGDPNCPDPGPGAPFAPHGISLGRRRDGAPELLVVDHAGREAIDFFEIVHDAAAGFAAIWRGCVRNDGPGLFNDVSIDPHGGFVATIMFDKPAAADRPGQPAGSGMAAILSGRDTGYLVAWSPGVPLAKLAGSDAAFNNGVQVSRDGRLIYFAAWTAKRLEIYDRASRKIIAAAPLDFLPDNLSLRGDGTFLVAGITDLAQWQDCHRRHAAFCPSGFEVAAWAPATGKVTPLFSGPPGLIAGASVAVEVDHALYVGSYSGDRLLRIAE